MAEIVLDESNINTPAPSKESAGDILSRMLQDKGATEALAVAANRGNKLATEGAGSDLLKLSYGELVLKYGEDVARNRNNIQGSLESYYQKANASRSVSEILSDSALSAGTGLTSIVGGLSSLTIAGAGKVAEKAGYDPKGFNDAAVGLNNATGVISDAIRSNQSQEIKDRYALSETERELDDADLESEFKDDNSFMGKLQKTGRATLNNADRILNDPAVAGDIVAGALGSLGPSVKLAQAGAKLATSAAVRVGASTGAQRASAALGAATGVGVSEASGTYSDTLNAVSGMTHEDLMKGSEAYRSDIESGVSKEDAKSNLAVNVGIEAFQRQIPVAIALGLLTSKFEQAPIGSFKGAGLVGGARNIASQTFEEAAQGGSSQLNQNIALRGNVDPDLDITTGIGEQIATGAIAGTGMAGTLAVPSATASVAKAGTKVATDIVNNPVVREGVENAVSKAGSLAADSIDGISKAAQILREKAKPITDPIAEATQPYRDQAKEAISKITTPIKEKVEEVANRPNEEIRREAVVAAEEVEVLLDKETEATTQKLPTELDLVSVPEAFKSSVKTEQSVPQKVKGLLTTLGDPKTKIDKLSPTEILYANKQFGEFQSIAEGVSDEAKAQINKVLNSPTVVQIRKRAAEIDLNAVHKVDTEVSPDTINESVQVAKINPANVNPEFVKKILNHNDRKDISNEDIKILETAAKIAEAVNTHRDNRVEISKELNVALSKKPNYQENSKDLPEVLSLDSVSRSIQIEGFTDAVGKDLPSAIDLASYIIQGAQTPDGKIKNQKGFEVDVRKYGKQMFDFATHMSNKVKALNQSFDQNTPEGKGVKVDFMSLVGGRKFVSTKDIGVNRAVTYHRNSPKSTEFASKVANDAEVVAKLYSFLQEAFPELLPSDKLVIPTLRKEGQKPVDNSSDATKEENNAEPDESIQAVQPEAESKPEDIKPTYIYRPVKNAKAILDWARSQGFPETVTEADLHVTVVYSKDAVDRNKSGIQARDGNMRVEGGKRTVERFGEDAVVLTLDSVDLQERYAEAKVDGVTSDFPTYRPHITIAYNSDMDVSKIKPYTGRVVLGPEVVEDIKTDEELATSKAVVENNSSVSKETETEGVEAPVEAEAISETDYEPANELDKLPERFKNAFKPRDTEVEFTDAESLLEKIKEKDTAYSKDYMKFVDVLMKPLMDGMNKRLETVTFSKKDPRSITEVIKSGEDIFTIRDYKNLLFVDPTTVKYNEQLLGLASLAVIDWLSDVRSSDPGRVNETLEELGVTFSDLTKEQMENIIFGVPPRQASETISKQVLKMWNMTINPDAPMVDSRGAVEGIVKELLTVLASETGFIEFADIPSVVDGTPRTTQTIVVKPMMETQKSIGLLGQASVRKFLSPSEISTPSIGEKISSVDQTQSYGYVPLSKVEQKTLRGMQDTAHFMSEGIVTLVEDLGFETIAVMLGYKDLVDFQGNQTLRRSIEGKNLSIQRNFEDAITVVEGIRQVSKNGTELDRIPVHYPVSISKVGRHQFRGVNPQSNKILRAMVTPTHSTLDMTSKEDQDAFWLTVAQASGLRKVENENHAKILSEIQDQFEAKYGEAVRLVGEWLESGEIEGSDLIPLMGTDIDIAQLNAVLAVAQLNFAKKNSTEKKFNATLSFELDGKTDGPANMMSNFGQGLLTTQDIKNLQKVGFFVGRTDTTLNDYFSAGNVDLYEVTSKRAEAEMFKRISANKKGDKVKLYAAARFAAKFGDFRMEEDGSIHMTRNTSKNPMTKTVYGSGVRGVGSGIANDMVIGLYQVLASAPEGVDLTQYINYPNLEKDIEILFGQPLPSELDINTFEFSKKALKTFEDTTVKGIGDILSTSAKDVIGSKITEVNDILVFLTNVQTEFLTALFDQKITELAEVRAKEGKIPRSKLKSDPKDGSNNTGPGVVRELSQRDYDQVVKELSIYAPLYSNGVQTLAVGAFSNQTTNIELSSNMNGDLRQKSGLMRPESAGVKIIPYISIGRGDAMMMNNIYSSDKAPTDTLPVFDGVDMPVDKVKEYASTINEAVLKNWDQDVLGDIVADFESFMRQTGTNDKLLVLQEAFEKVQSVSKSSSVSARTTSDLLEDLRQAQKLNQARKKAFKRIPVSVDHMGGSDTSFSRGEGRETPMTLSEINQIIQEELDRVEPEIVLPESERYQGIQVTTAGVMMKALLRETRDQVINASVRAIRNKVPKDLKIVTGSIDELNAYRQENYPDDGQVITGAGSLDTTNNVIFLAKKSNETLAHELIHAATFDLVLKHYEGTPNDAVERLEGLMDEFMGLDMSNDSKQVQESFNAARTAILGFQIDGEAFSKAAALNEFMAWTLSNEQLAKTLKTTRTSALARLTKKVLHLFKKLMGGVPNDMFSQIVFNTRVLDRVPTESTPGTNSDSGGGFDLPTNDNDNTGGNQGGGSDGVTPTFKQYTNFWIDLVRQRLDENKERNESNLGGKPGNQRTAADLKNVNKRSQLLRYKEVADDVVQRLNFGGFSLGVYEADTFKAIHMVLATEMRLDATSAETLNATFEHVTNNLKPEMFENEEQFSTVMEMFGRTKNDEGVSDGIATLLALSQTSKVFRDALDQIPLVEGETIDTSSLNNVLGTAASMLMRKAIGSVDLAGSNMNDVLNNLSDSILREDNEKDFRGLSTLMDSLTAADKYTSGMLSQMSRGMADINDSVRESTRSELTKSIVGAISLTSNFLDKDRSSISVSVLKDATHSGAILSKLIPLREFVTEVIGTDEINAETIALHDRTSKAVSAARQSFREDVPVILQNFFNSHPNETEWKSLHRVLGKGDFSVLFDIAKPNESMRLVSQPKFLDRKIKDAEQAIKSNFSKDTASEILAKVQQLARFMTGQGAGHQLRTNAYAINKLAGEYNEAMTVEIDNLVSMYALKEADQTQKDDITRMYENDAEGVKALLVYMTELNKGEDNKIVSEEAKLNGYKGYIPDEGAKDAKLIIDSDRNKERLLELGYVRIADAPADAGISTDTHGYYFTTAKQTGTYTQGVMQSVRSSYRGVDANNGLSINGLTYGSITGESADAVTDAMNHIAKSMVEWVPNLVDNKEAFLPRYNEDLTVSHYERVINPDLIESHMKPRSNLALMIGSWEGRQTEEKLSQQYNNELVNELNKIYEKRGSDEDGLFINLVEEAKTVREYNNASKAKKKLMKKGDQIYADAWNVIPPETKELIQDTFGEGEFWVRKDMINLSVGYRESSIIDSWTGKTRLPEGVQETIRAATKLVLGDRAVTILTGGEKGLQSLVSSAKQLITIRSLVVPYMNMQANVIQLATNGVGTKDMYKGYKDKFKEIEIYNNNIVKLLELKTRIRLAGDNANRVGILEDQIQVINDENARMSIAPLIEAGAYKNISEGITDLDVQLTSGRFAEYLDNQVNKLPGPLRTAVKYGFVSKDTALYKGANKAVQYGDFLAKSIYYDHMVQRMKLDPKEAMKRMNEEFVNYSTPPGRVRSSMESMGLTWFLTFKIRILKIAMKQMRDNPLRALITANTVGDQGSPIEDNLVSVVADDKLGYSLGLGMLTTAPELNPWVNISK